MAVTGVEEVKMTIHPLGDYSLQKELPVERHTIAFLLTRSEDFV